MKSLLLTFIILFFTNLKAYCQQPVETKLDYIFELHEDIGREIDSTEKIKYNLFEFIPNEEFETGAIYRSGKYIYIRVITKGNNIVKQYITPEELEREFNKIAFYKHENEKKRRKLYNDQRNYISTSSSFVGHVIMHNYFLEKDKYISKTLSKDLSNHVNFNINYGIFIGNLSHIELGLNYQIGNKFEYLKDSSYTYYYINTNRLVFQNNRKDYAAEPYSIRNNLSTKVSNSNVGITIAVRNILSKGYWKNIYHKNSLTFNIVNKYKIDYLDQVELRDINYLDVIYIEERGQFNPKSSFSLCFNYQYMLGLEIKVDPRYSINIELPFNYSYYKTKIYNNYEVSINNNYRYEILSEKGMTEDNLTLKSYSLNPRIGFLVRINGKSE